MQFGDGESLEVDLVVVSVGRRPYSESLGLDGADRRSSSTSGASSRSTSTAAPAEAGVYAVGDLIATPQLAHVGFAEGICVIKDILGEDPVPVDYDRVPWCIYCHPEVAFAGYSEEAAKDAGLRRRHVEAPLHRQQPGADHRRDRRHGEDHRREDRPTARRPDPRRAHGRARGSPSSSGRATWPSTGRPPSTRSPQFIQPHPTLSELFGETVLALTGRSLHG